jgi:hypothetical protein
VFAQTFCLVLYNTVLGKIPGGPSASAGGPHFSYLFTKYIEAFATQSNMVDTAEYTLFEQRSVEVGIYIVRASEMRQALDLPNNRVRDMPLPLNTTDYNL